MKVKLLKEVRGLKAGTLIEGAEYSHHDADHNATSEGSKQCAHFKVPFIMAHPSPPLARQGRTMVATVILTEGIQIEVVGA